MKPCAIIVAALGALSAARGADLRCDTPGVQNLGLLFGPRHTAESRCIGKEVAASRCIATIWKLSAFPLP